MHDARAFNQNITSWNVTNVVDMVKMFGTKKKKSNMAFKVRADEIRIIPKEVALMFNPITNKTNLKINSVLASQVWFSEG